MHSGTHTHIHTRLAYYQLWQFPFKGPKVCKTSDVNNTLIPTLESTATETNFVVAASLVFITVVTLGLVYKPTNAESPLWIFSPKHTSL